MTEALEWRDGRGDVVFVAPHGEVAHATAAPFVRGDAAAAEVEAYLADWHDLGSREALLEAVARTGAPGALPRLPRGLVDLNRGRALPEAQETLFGKGPITATMRAWLAPGAEDALLAAHRGALARLSVETSGARALVELHSYGDLGSSYDRATGGRPVRRAEAAVVTATPWATARPLGLARFIPADLPLAPWRAQRALGQALDAAGFRVGPHPYPQQGPWALSARFVAAHWFTWLGEIGRLTATTAAALADMAWRDEHDPRQATLGPDSEALAALMGAWTHEAGALGEAFTDSGRAVGLTAELRVDLASRGAAFGAAVAAGVTAGATGSLA